MRDTYLSFSPPSLGDEERAEVDDTLRSSWITKGPKTSQFEQDFASYIGASSSLALNSCTAALHLGLIGLGVRSGDEVITTPLTFCATVNVIEHVGARPVLVDVDPETLQIDPAGVERALTPATRVILPVHFMGYPCDMDAILGLARAPRRDVRVIEDAAHALPAAYRGRRVGTIGDLTAFSFYATKNLTTGEGGMLTGEDEELFDRLRVMSLHGMSSDAWRRYGQGASWFYEVVAPGFKYNMTDIQAAIGLHQLRKLPGFHQRRKDIASQYSAAFSGSPSLELPPAHSHVDPAWHLYVLRLRPESLTIDRATFIKELDARKIGASVHFIPVHLHPYYRDKYDYQPDDLPIAYQAFQRMISLPLHPGLSDADVADVIDAVLDVVEGHRR